MNNRGTKRPQSGVCARTIWQCPNPFIFTSSFSHQESSSFVGAISAHCFPQPNLFHLILRLKEYPRPLHFTPKGTLSLNSFTASKFDYSLVQPRMKSVWLCLIGLCPSNFPFVWMLPLSVKCWRKRAFGPIQLLQIYGKFHQHFSSPLHSRWNSNSRVYTVHPLESEVLFAATKIIEIPKRGGEMHKIFNLDFWWIWKNIIIP